MPTLGDVGQLLGGLALLFNVWLTWRTNHVARKIVDKVNVIEQSTNGLTSKLLEVTSKAKFAEGVKHGEDYAKRIPK